MIRIYNYTYLECLDDAQKLTKNLNDPLGIYFKWNPQRYQNLKYPVVFKQEPSWDTHSRDDFYTVDISEFVNAMEIHLASLKRSVNTFELYLSKFKK